MDKLAQITKIVNVARHQLQEVTGLNLQLISGTDDIAYRIILEAVCKTLGVSEIKILGESRHQPIVFARYCIIYFLNSYRPGLGPVAIGRYMNRDHSSITNAIEVTENLLSYEDEKFMQPFNKCTPIIKDLLK